METGMSARSSFRRLAWWLVVVVPVIFILKVVSIESAAQTGVVPRNPGEQGSVGRQAGPTVSEGSDPLLLGRVKYDRNNGNDCPNVGNALVNLVSQACTLNLGGTRTVELSSEELVSFPFLFMNGHGHFNFSEKERETLRNYFENGGFLLASGCCDRREFPISMRRELTGLFEGQPSARRAKFERMPYDHLIYRIQHTVERVTSLNRKTDIYLEGLFFDGRLVAVLCDEGLCCSFSMGNHCNKDRGVPPEIGPRLAVNIAIYALTH